MNKPILLMEKRLEFVRVGSDDLYIWRQKLNDALNVAEWVGGGLEHLMEEDFSMMNVPILSRNMAFLKKDGASPELITFALWRDIEAIWIQKCHEAERLISWRYEIDAKGNATGFRVRGDGKRIHYTCPVDLPEQIVRLDMLKEIHNKPNGLNAKECAVLMRGYGLTMKDLKERNPVVLRSLIPFIEYGSNQS